jgi:HK97 family phage prohead protease
MELGCTSVPLELKFAGEDKPAGYFEGYGTVYGNVDQGGDMIEHGACAKSLANMDRTGYKLSMFYNHDRKGGTIGVWDAVSEDANGLYVKGRLIGLDTEQGKMNMARLKEGAIKGMSIGYRVPPYGSRRGSGKMGEPSRILKEIDVKEISIVDDPMNLAARLSFVKSAQWLDAIPAEEIKTIREFEDFLRDVGGFSRAAAKSIASGGFKAQTDPRDADDVGEHIRKRLSALATAISK